MTKIKPEANPPASPVRIISNLIVADKEVHCDVWRLENFDRPGVSHTATKIKLLKNLNLSHRLRKANHELSLLGVS